MWMQSDVKGDVCKVTGFFLPHVFCVLSYWIGRARGLQGSFSIKDLIRLSSLLRPPSELPTDFKGVGRNSPNAVLFCAAFILSVISAYYTKHTSTQISHTCSNVWNWCEFSMWQQASSLACIMLHMWSLLTQAPSTCSKMLILRRFAIFTPFFLQCFRMLTFTNCRLVRRIVVLWFIYSLIFSLHVSVKWSAHRRTGTESQRYKK